MLSKQFLQEAEKELLQLKEEMEHKLALFAKKDIHADDYDSEFPDYGDKKDDNAAEVEEYGRELSREQLLEKTLEDIKNALRKISEGVYGICEKCGKEIKEERLRIYYQARLCIECKEKNA